MGNQARKINEETAKPSEITEEIKFKKPKME